MIEPLRHTELLPGTLQNLFYPPEDYVYFARAAEMPFHQAGTLRKAAWAMDASMLAYARYGKRRMEPSDIDTCFLPTGLTCTRIGKNMDDWNAPGTQAIFAEGENFAILAFRGTEADDPKDLHMDLKFVPDPTPLRIPSMEDAIGVFKHLSLVTSLIRKPGRVHPGFQDALDEVWDTVRSLVMGYRAAHPDAEICFTGHSLGGALAVLAFSRFADANSSLYTFGCPRVGDAIFRDQVLLNPGKGIYRYVNYNDAVTHVPPDGSAYRQTPDDCRRFDVNGVLDKDDGSFKGDVESLGAALWGLAKTISEVPAALNLSKAFEDKNLHDAVDLNKIDAPPSLVDHSPARYCFRLWDCV